MKKILATVLALALVLSLGAAAFAAEETVITIGASPTPHAVILEKAAEILAEQGIKLDIVEYTDYVQPNLAVDSGDLDANYFQHTPYLTSFNEEQGTDVVSVCVVHYEPMGIYAGDTDSLDALEEGASVAIPNDSSNGTRALLLLQQEGLIVLKEGVDASTGVTVYDVEENPLNLQFEEVEAAQLTNVLQDVAIAVINGNYAQDAGLTPDDALALEDASGDAAQYYGNLVGVKAGNEDNEAIQALVAVLQSEEIAQFITETFTDGSVVPVSAPEAKEEAA